MRMRWLLTLLALTCAPLAGCATLGATPAATHTPAPALPTSTATTAPTATPASPVTTTFTCPVTASGGVHIFNDSQTGLQFSFPAAWTENSCQRISAAGGISQTLEIGNVFFVSMNPRKGMTIQQYVDELEGSDETVTLTPITVAHAVDAASVSVTASPTASQPPRFIQTTAIIEGTQSFYEVHSIIAQMSMSDTMPNQPLSNVIATFDVP